MLPLRAICGEKLDWEAGNRRLRWVILRPPSPCSSTGYSPLFVLSGVHGADAKIKTSRARDAARGRRSQSRLCL